MLECRIYCTVLQKRNIRTNFYDRFARIVNERLVHVVFFHAACWPLHGRKQLHTVLTLQKTPLLSEIAYDIRTRAGPKTRPEKV